MSDQRSSSESAAKDGNAGSSTSRDSGEKGAGAASSEEVRLLLRMTGLAFQFGTEIIAGVLLGWGFDRLFGTQPWGILIGSLAGIAVATLDLIRKAIQMNRQMDALPRSPFDLTGKRTGNREPGEPEHRRPPGGPDAPDDDDLDALNHERWKAAVDRELEPDDDDRKHARDKDDGKQNAEG